MTATDNPTVSLTMLSDTEVVATREFDAPRELVFRAYTDPTLVARWYSPGATVDKLDLRAGGAWRYVIDANAGIAFSGEYREVVPPERIVRTENFELVGPGHEVLDTVVFQELEGDRTKMTETMLFTSVADRDGMLQSGMETGFAASLRTLDDLLAELKQSA